MLRAGTGHPARQPGPAGPAGPDPPGPGDPGRRRSVCRGRHQPRQPPAARGEAPGTTTAPGNPPAAAQTDADHIAPAPSPVRPVQTVGTNQPGQLPGPGVRKGGDKAGGLVGGGTPSSRSSASASWSTVVSMTRSGAAGTSAAARAGPGRGAERDLGLRHGEPARGLPRPDVAQGARRQAGGDVQDVQARAGEESGDVGWVQPRRLPGRPGYLIPPDQLLTLRSS